MKIVSGTPLWSGLILWLLVGNLFAQSESLVDLIREGRVQEVAQRLDDGVDPNRADVAGRIPLIVAAMQGNREMVGLLLQHGVRVKAKGRAGITALHGAAQTGQAEIVRLLTGAGADIDAQNENGKTPLIEAAARGHSQTVADLLEAGGNLDIRDYSGWDALTFAVQFDRTETVIILVAGGATPHRLDPNDRLLYAAGFASAEQVQDAIDGGANVATRDRNNATPLLRAARRGRHDNLEVLLKNGADAAATDSRQNGALLYAYQSKDILTLETLLRFSGKTLAVDAVFLRAVSENQSAAVQRLIRYSDRIDPKLPQRALFDAIWGGSFETAAVLIQSGTEPDYSGWSRKAAEAGRDDVLLFFRRQGWDLNTRDAQGLPLSFHYIESGDAIALQTLIAAGLDFEFQDDNGRTVLMVAAATGETESVTALLQSGAIVDAMDYRGQTAFFHAVMAGRRKTVGRLVELGADVNHVSHGGLPLSGSRTALILAAERNDPGMIQLLLEAGADVNLSSTDGMTALMAAARKGAFEPVRLLLEAGAEVRRYAPYEKNGQYSTLMFAAASGGSAMVQMLIDAGADVNFLNEQGRTPLLIARESENQQAIQILLEAGAKP